MVRGSGESRPVERRKCLWVLVEWPAKSSQIGCQSLCMASWVVGPGQLHRAWCGRVALGHTRPDLPAHQPGWLLQREVQPPRLHSVRARAVPCAQTAVKLGLSPLEHPSAEASKLDFGHDSKHFSGCSPCQERFPLVHEQGLKRKSETDRKEIQP